VVEKAHKGEIILCGVRRVFVEVSDLTDLLAEIPG
jgi:hypothetical protein